MALDVTPTNLLREVLAARDAVEPLHKAAREMRQAYAESATEQASQHPENHYYEYISLVLPKVCYEIISESKTNLFKSTLHMNMYL